MSCPICHRSSCILSFHSLEAQERYEARQSMSDDVEVLREELQDTQEELAQARQDLKDAQERADSFEERARWAESEVVRLGGYVGDI